MGMGRGGGGRRGKGGFQSAPFDHAVLGGFVDLEPLQLFEFFDFEPEVLQGLDGVTGREVDDESEDLGALDVAQEAEAQAAIEMGALDEARDVGDGDQSPGVAAAVVVALGFDLGPAVVVVEDDGADVGLERGELPVADSGAAFAEGAQERAFPCVGEPDEADVGEQFEFELEDDGHAGFTSGGEFGAGHGSRYEVGVASSSRGPCGEQYRLLHRLGKI